MGFSGEVCLGPKLGIGKVDLLGATVGKGFVEVACFEMIWRT